MGDSIAAAVRATRDAEGWLVLPGDLPLVKAETLRAVADALGGAEVVVPAFNGERGHPVAFGRGCGDELAALSGPKGAVSVIRAHQVTELAVDDEGVVTDIDTVEALARGEQVLVRRGA
jgi:molybdenum cofactor cytidylyltransferase